MYLPHPKEPRIVKLTMREWPDKKSDVIPLTNDLGSNRNEELIEINAKTHSDLL
jgi:hypothetical protein